MQLTCIRCKSNPVRPRPLGSAGRGRGTLLCHACRLIRNTRESGVPKWVKKYKKPHCEHCGFKALHPCQLDVDHIDGDRENNAQENLQTLCANCHRLKTILSRDHLNWVEQSPSVEPPQLRLVI